MEKIKIIMVEDHEVYRDGLRLTIEFHHHDIIILGETKYGSVFFDMLKSDEYACVDVVLLDIGLLDMSGIDIARRLKMERPDIRILIITADNTVFNISEMLNIGVEGFLSKFHCSSDEVVEAVRAVAQGLNYYGEDISAIMSHIYIEKKKPMSVTSEFSQQERSIIELSHEGLRAKQIASHLSIAPKTVEWHKSRIFQKLGINSTKEMVDFAIKSGIIRVERGELGIRNEELGIKR